MLSRGNSSTLLRASILIAAAPSSSAALVINTTRTNPIVSTSRGSLGPLIFLPPSYPHSCPPTSVVFTDWLSIQAALGVGSRPSWTRTRVRSRLRILVHVPSSRHWAKYSYTVLLGNKSGGNISH